MRLLLDTHALIWFCEGHSKLGKKARAALEDNSNECFVSQATPWEMATKLSLGRLELRMGLEEFFPGVLNANGFVFLESKVSHYAELARLPFHHRDPFDRLLVAQARVEEMVLVTCDGFASDYGVPVLW